MPTVAAVTIFLLTKCSVTVQEGDNSVPEFTVYSWTRMLDNGTNVTEFAASIESGPRIFFASKDRDLFSAGLLPAATIIDFSTNTTVSLFLSETCVCILSSLSLFSSLSIPLPFSLPLCFPISH